MDQVGLDSFGINCAQQPDMGTKAQCGNPRLQNLPVATPAVIILSRDIQADRLPLIQQQPDHVQQVLMPFDNIQPTARKQPQRLARLRRDVRRITAQGVSIHAHRLDQQPGGQVAGNGGFHLGQQLFGNHGRKTRSTPFEPLPGAIILQRAMQRQAIGRPAQPARHGGNQGGAPAGMHMHMGDVFGLAGADKLPGSRQRQGDVGGHLAQFGPGHSRQSGQRRQGLDRPQIQGPRHSRRRPVMRDQPFGRRTGAENPHVCPALFHLGNLAPEKDMGLAGELRHQIADFRGGRHEGGYPLAQAGVDGRNLKVFWSFVKGIKC